MAQRISSSVFRLARRPLFWLILACFAIRVGYIASGAPTPVQFDARIYVSSAVVLPLLVSHPKLMLDRDAQESISYDLVYGDRLQGETVKWLYYAPPTFAQAVDGIFFAGPVYPAILSVLFSPNWSDFTAARIFNAACDAATCGLLFWLLAMTVGRWGGYLGAALFVIYPGTIIKCGELNLEPISALGVTLVIALSIWGLQQNRLRGLFFAGLVAGVLVLTKAALTLLIIFIGLAVAIVAILGRRSISRTLLTMATGFIIPVLPWVLLVWIRYGVPGVRDPSYGSANFRSSNILADRGYDLDQARPDFWTYPVYQKIVSQPGAYVHLYLEKFYRLWNRSYNDYRIPLLTGVGAQVWFHRLLALLAILGVFFWPRKENDALGLIPLAAIVYISVLHTVFHSLTRYALPAIPLFIGAAAVGVHSLRVEHRTPLTVSRWGPIGILAILTYLAWEWLDVAIMLGLLPGVAPATGQVLVNGIRAAILIVDLYALCWLLRCTPRAKLAGTVALIGGLALLWVRGLPQETWAEWSTKLYRPQQMVEREIVTPVGFDWRQVVDMRLVLDIQSGGGEDFTLYVQVDSTVIALPEGEFSQSFYPKPAYRPFLRAYGKKKEEIRQWVDIAVTKEHVQSLITTGRLTVRVWVAHGGSHKNYVRVYGNYRVGDWDDWQGPTFLYPSVERLYEEGDPRVWETIPRKLVSAENRYISARGSSAQDLSEMSGRQTGDYRILLIAKMSNNQNVFF